MKTLDRYIVRNFLITATLFFVVMMLLRVVADLAINVDDFTHRFAELKIKTFGGKVGHVLSYYGYQSLTYFVELGGVIIVASAAFTLVMMNHTNELTAMLASGVSLHRVALPIVLCAMAMGGLILLDQEIIIPKVAHILVLKRGEVAETKEFAVTLITDGQGTVWWAESYHAGQQQMHFPVAFIRDKNRCWLALISGSKARPYTLRGRGGWLIEDARLVPNKQVGRIWPEIPDSTRIWSTISPLEILKEARQVYLQACGKDASLEGFTSWPDAKVFDPVYDLTIQGHFVPDPSPNHQADSQWGGRWEKPIFTFTEPNGKILGCFLASSAHWMIDDQTQGFWKLEKGAMFYPSDMTPDDLLLRQSSSWIDYMSTSDLARLIQLKRVPDRRAGELIKHSRFTAPINNLVMLLLALPFILSRERNIKASTTLCVLTVLTFFAFVYICRYIGLNPVLAAWLPILPFGPVAIIMLDSLKT